MAKEDITMKYVGIKIDGNAILNLWGGGQGSIEMETYFLEKKFISKDNILRCVNDNGFGCESIDSASISIWDVYRSACGEEITNYNRCIESNGVQSEKYLGWNHLRKIGAIK